MDFFHEGSPFSLEPQTDLNRFYEKVFLFGWYTQQVRLTDLSH